MGVLNRIVNIVVLLLAIAAVVCSVLLTKKREQLVDGYKQMAAEIQSTKKALEANKDSNVKVALPSLDHKDYEQLGKLKGALSKKVTEVAQQRDDLASALVDLGTTLEIAEVGEPKIYQDVTTYTDSASGLKTKVTAVQERVNGVAAGIKATGQKVNIEIAEESIKSNDQYKDALGKLNDAVEDAQTRREAYAGHISKLATALGVDGPRLEGNEDYTGAMRTHVGAVDEYRAKHEQTVRDLASERQRVKETQAKLAEKEQKVLELNDTIAQRDKQIEKLKIIIYGNTTQQGPKVEEGTAELMARLEGQVVEVNKKWDFVVINLGNKSQVTIDYGAKKQTKDAPLPNEKEMVVSRGDGQSAQCIANIKVVKVYDYCAIANVLPSPATGKAVQVGDMVRFTQSQIEEFRKEEKKNAVDAAVDAPAL